jgi:hypothetical protein
MLRLFVFLYLFLGAIPGTEAAPVPPRNYVVLLDLSDRILQSNQPRRDRELVQAVFAEFEQHVRQQFIINSTDRFCVVIAPQKGVRYQPEAFMDSLYLDLNRVQLADKRTRLEALKARLPIYLARLYEQALVGMRQPQDFAGCDLWQYFNEQLPSDLSRHHQNTLVVMTDGYFDFEHNTHALQRANRFTDSRALTRLRQDPNWRQTLQRPTEGLLPVPKQLPNLRVLVAEINPKVDHLAEADLLTALWDKWLREMKVTRWQCQAKGSLNKSVAGLRSFLAG